MLQLVCTHDVAGCNTQSRSSEDGQNNCPKHDELTGIINKPLLLHLVGCLYYLYQWCAVKQISDNEIYLLIKYIKSVLWRVAKRLSYIEDARCLKVKYRVTDYLHRTLTTCFDVNLPSVELSVNTKMCTTVKLHLLEKETLRLCTGETGTTSRKDRWDERYKKLKNLRSGCVLWSFRHKQTRPRSQGHVALWCIGATFRSYS